MQTQTELITIESFEKGLTKLEIRNIADELVEKVLEEGNPLKVAEGLAAMESFIKEVKDDKRFKDYVREEAGKHPKGFVSASGAKIECMESPGVFDYSNCNDSVHTQLVNEFEAAKKALKERETLLKAIPSSGLPQEKLNEETGEIEKWTIYPPSKSSSSTYKITLAK
jgi:hypothetical protein